MALAIIFESVGVGEWFVLLAVILVVVGPKKLPSTARKFGQYYSKFRRAADGFKRQLLEMDTEFTNAVREAEDAVSAAEKEVDQAANDVASDLTPPDPSEYGGIDANYPDYGGYDPSRAESEASEPAQPEAPAEQAAKAEEPKKPSNGIKITVSPVPGASKTVSGANS